MERDTKRGRETETEKEKERSFLLKTRISQTGNIKMQIFLMFLVSGLKNISLLMVCSSILGNHSACVYI
jgi:hypothetical protein